MSQLTHYNIANSLNRINRILDSNPRDKFEKRRSIPSESEMTFENGCYVDCIALSIDIRDSSQLPKMHTKPVLAKIYRAYISEVTALMKSCKLNRHIRIVGDCVIGVFNAPQPEVHTKEILYLGARMGTLINVLNDRLEKKNYQKIRVGIGAAFGEALMVKAGYSGSGINNIVWMGDVINRASKLGNAGNKTTEDEQFLLCDSFWNVLPQSVRDELLQGDLASRNHYYECTQCTIHHVPTTGQYQKIKIAKQQNRQKPSLPTYVNPFSTTIPNPFLQSDEDRRTTLLAQLLSQK